MKKSPTPRKNFPKELLACPCCGYKTLETRADYAICCICWWEDDGLDNIDANNHSGPNNGISLTQARYYFLTHGIYNPKRKDLLAKKSKKLYEKGRFFEIADLYIIEKQTLWQEKIIPYSE